MDNAIYGSAKAWANITGSTGAIRASYNVSSVTRNSTGYYTVAFTTALTDANYVPVASVGPLAPTAATFINASAYNVGVTPTTTAFSFVTANAAAGTQLDVPYVLVAVFR